MLIYMCVYKVSFEEIHLISHLRTINSETAVGYDSWSRFYEVLNPNETDQHNRQCDSLSLENSCNFKQWRSHPSKKCCSYLTKKYTLPDSSTRKVRRTIIHGLKEVDHFCTTAEMLSSINMMLRMGLIIHDVKANWVVKKDWGLRPSGSRMKFQICPPWVLIIMHKLGCWFQNNPGWLPLFSKFAAKILDHMRHKRSLTREFSAAGSIIKPLQASL